MARQFGAVRALPSGRYQASYVWRGARRKAPHTFAYEHEALSWLAAVKHTIDATGKPPVVAPKYVSPRITFKEYALAEISKRESGEDRRRIKPTSANLYRARVNRFKYANRRIDTITREEMVTWHASRANSLSERTQEYRLFRSIFRQAVEDGLIEASPCVIVGGSVAPDRKRQPVFLEDPDIEKLLAEITPQLKAAVALAAYGGLRLSEVLALTRADIDFENRTVTVSKQLVNLKGKGLTVAPPKSKAGNRTIGLRKPAWPILETHFAAMALVTDDAPLFSSVTDPHRYISKTNFNKHWTKARDAVGLTGTVFHHLRHGHITRVARAGATLAEILHIAGQSKPSTALIYMLTDTRRSVEILDRMDA